MEICECGHPLESHAVHAPHYCHEDCQCDAYVQATKATHLDRFRDAVVEAILVRHAAFKAWKEDGGFSSARALGIRLDDAEKALEIAVDAYLAAMEGP